MDSRNMMGLVHVRHRRELTALALLLIHYDTNIDMEEGLQN